MIYIYTRPSSRSTHNNKFLKLQSETEAQQLIKNGLLAHVYIYCLLLLLGGSFPAMVGASTSNETVNHHHPASSSDAVGLDSGLIHGKVQQWSKLK